MVDLSTVSSMVSRSSNETTERSACIYGAQYQDADGSGLYVPFGQWVQIFLFFHFFYLIGFCMRMAFTIAMRATPTSAKTASQSVAIPPAPRMRTSSFTRKPARCSARQSGGFACPRMNGGSHSRRLVRLYHYIGGFDGGIAAKSAHGDAHMARAEPGHH